MAVEIKVPIPDQTTEEVRIVAWKKAVGDTVTKGEIILEIETDKAVMEVESSGDGVVLQQLVVVDDMVAVGKVIGSIGAAGEKVAAASDTAPAPAAKAAAPTPQQTEVQAPAGEGVTEVKVPIPDQTTEEVRIVAWKKAVGDTVAKGEIILEIETDKAVMEVESAGDGILLQQLTVVDDMVAVGKVIGFIGPAGTQVTAAAAPAPTAQAAPAKQVTTAGFIRKDINITPLARKIAEKTGLNLDNIKGTGAGGKIVRKDLEKGSSVHDGRLFASPNAKRLAKELTVDIYSIAGSGPNGRIIGKDVTEYAANKPAAAETSSAASTRPHDGRLLASPNAKRLAEEMGVDISLVAGTGPNGRITGDDVTAYAQNKPTMDYSPADGQPQPGTEVPLTKMRRAIGINLQNSFRDTPHFNVTMSIDMTRAIKFRSQINKGKEKIDKVSVNDLVIKGCSMALRQYPAVNSKFLEDRIKYEADVNIGIATALPTGLIVPVVMNADKLDWKNLAAEAKSVIQQARAGKLIGLGKGTFTVSNLGMFGVDEFTAIINPPEAAILAVGGLKQEVISIDGMIGVKPIMKVTLCSDHRVVDGALAAQFLLSLKRYLEEDIA